MNDLDELTRSLHALASSAPGDAGDLLPAVHRRVSALRRRRKAAASATVGVLAVAGLAAGVGLAAQSGGTTASTAADRAPDAADAVAPCPLPDQVPPRTIGEKERTPEQQAKADGVAAPEAGSGSGVAGSPDTAAAPNSGPGAKGRAVIEHTTDSMVTFRFDGMFAGDPSLATNEHAIDATIDASTVWLEAGNPAHPRVLPAGTVVRLAVSANGGTVRLALVDVAPDRDARDAKDTTDGVVRAKGTVSSWAPDHITIEVIGDAGPSTIVAVPGDETKTIAGDVGCAPTPLPVGTPVAVTVRALDASTWRLLSLSY